MLRRRAPAEIRPSPYQLDGLRLWPPPNAGYNPEHNHGSEPGERCKNELLRYDGAAQCPRCGRVWLKGPLPPKNTPPDEIKAAVATLQGYRDELAQIEELDRGYSEEQTALRTKRRSLANRRRRIKATLAIWEQGG